MVIQRKIRDWRPGETVIDRGMEFERSPAIQKLMQEVTGAAMGIHGTALVGVTVHVHFSAAVGEPLATEPPAPPDDSKRVERRAFASDRVAHIYGVPVVIPAGTKLASDAGNWSLIDAEDSRPSAMTGSLRGNDHPDEPA